MVAAAIAYLVAARELRDFVARLLVPRRLRPEAVLLASRTAYGVLLGLGGFVFLSFVLGTPSVAITGFLAAALATGLGIQDILRNYVSGFYLLIERHVQVGDVIEFQGRRGTVTEVRMRVTFMRADNGALIVIPNASLFNEMLVVDPRAESRVEGEPEPVRSAPRGRSSRRPRTSHPPGASPP
jgi:small-conductance mechanosensitive channel